MITLQQRPRSYIVVGFFFLVLVVLGTVIIQATREGQPSIMQNQRARVQQQAKKKSTKTKSSKQASSVSNTSPTACSPGWSCTARGTKGQCAMASIVPGAVEFGGECGVEGCRGQCYRPKVETSQACDQGWTCTARGTKSQCAMAAAPAYPVDYSGSCGVEGCRGQCFRKRPTL